MCIDRAKVIPRKHSPYHYTTSTSLDCWHSANESKDSWCWFQILRGYSCEPQQKQIHQRRLHFSRFQLSSWKSMIVCFALLPHNCLLENCMGVYMCSYMLVGECTFFITNNYYINKDYLIVSLSLPFTHSLFVLYRVAEAWSLSQRTKGTKWGTPCTECQSIVVHKHTHTHYEQFESAN